MLPYYIRLIFLLVIWMITIISSYLRSTDHVMILLFCAFSLSLYFILPIWRKKLIIFILLIVSTFIYSIFIEASMYPYIIVLFLFYIFEASMVVNPVHFRAILWPGLTLIIVIIYRIENHISFEYLINCLSLLLFSVGFFYVNSYYNKLQDQKMLYESVLEELRKVKRHALKNEHAARTEERTRIAREMHDSVGHKLTALSMQIEMMLIQYRDEKLQSMKELISECLEETRKAVRVLENVEVEGISSIIHLIRKLESESNLRIHFTTKQGVMSLSLSNKHSVVIYRVLQESLTNSMKYSHSRDIYIILGLTAIGELSFEMRNSFHEKRKFHEGFGLRNMRERVMEIGGTIHFYQTGEEFIIEGNIPIGGQGND